MHDEEPGIAIPATRRIERGVAFIMASARLDAPTAEKILAAIAGRTDRPAAEVADDLVLGRPFPGRPGWL